MSNENIGRIGIWARFDPWSANKTREAVAELEELGYGAIWAGESLGREAFAQAGLMLAGGRRIAVATGVANMWARDAMTMAAGQYTLAEAYPSRFLLGIGVSHAPLVENVRGHSYGRPLAAMRAYLDAMDAAPFGAARPASPPTRVLGALGPKMLALSGQRAGGAHTFFMPVEHTARARRVLGEGPLLAVEQAVVLETDRDRARQIARGYMSACLSLPNYANELRRLGFVEGDLANGGSDKLFDAIIGWGTENAIVQRVQAHHAVGADHVCAYVLDAEPEEPPISAWRRLAGALLS
jgi:probable F420-dependent oxidoreductase